MEEETEEIAGFSGEDYDLLIMDGFDDCIEGIVERFGQSPIVCYNKQKVLSVLEEEMNPEEALEWFEFNQRRETERYISPNSYVHHDRTGCAW